MDKEDLRYYQEKAAKMLFIDLGLGVNIRHSDFTLFTRKWIEPTPNVSLPLASDSEFTPHVNALPCLASYLASDNDIHKKLDAILSLSDKLQIKKLSSFLKSHN